MTRLLVKHAEVLVTMDALRREITGGALIARDNVIKAVGTPQEVEAWIAEQPQEWQPERIIDVRGAVVIPGLVNGHHHLYQTLTHTAGTARGLSLFDWLKTLYTLWAEMDGETVYVTAKVGLAELLLSGATSVADHLYLRCKAG